MSTKVADVRANQNENITFAAKAIGRSKHRRRVFEAIYSGQKKVKTIQEIMAATGLSNQHASNEAGKLYADQIVGRVKLDGRNAFGYVKDEFFARHRDKILRIVDDPGKAKKFPTKQAPQVTGATTTYKVVVRGTQPKAKPITIDEIDSFRAVRPIKTRDKGLRLSTWSESRIKKGIPNILGENYEFKDWGGERNDLFTKKLTLSGKRRASAFALKGKATKGTLTPKMMGKNGDQIARLVGSAAEVFFVVYHSKIDESITEQLRAFSIAKSMSGSKIYYGTIDGDDLNRLVQAYRSLFQRN
jgi:hypothetical protein